jgi:curved DNA-binding protein
MASPRKNNPYTTLGVAKDADEETIRKAYRKLARELHPDVNPDKEAEERFKAVSEANAILSDAQKRRDYDEFGDIALEAGFDAAEARRAQQAFGGGFGGHSDFGGRGFGFGGLEDLVSDMFGQGRAGPRSRRGATLEAELELDFLEAARGGEQRFSISRPTASGGQRTESVSVRIPPGVADGGRIRLRGKGGEGVGEGVAGDLIATIRIRPHEFFRREDRDIYLDVPLTVAEATLGAKVEVPTLGGRVTVTIPAGTDSGSKLRLKGKGVRHPSGGSNGDFYVVAKVCVPRELDAEAQAKLEELSAFGPKGLRDALDRSS